MYVVLCGPPASGKSTLARGLQGRLASRGHEFDRLSSDAFTRQTYEQLYDRVADSDADWILDGTFYKRTWQEWFRRLDDVHFVHVHADRETCLARNRARSEPISETGLYTIYAEFEPPPDALTIDTEDQSVAAALDELEAVVLSWLASQ